MSFRDMVADDVKSVFLDLETFGEIHRVEGKDIPIVISNDELVKRQGGNDLAVAESGTLFYASVADLPPRRSPNQSLNVDGRECIIDAWQVEEGIAIIVLRETIIG